MDQFWSHSSTLLVFKKGNSVVLFLWLTVSLEDIYDFWVASEISTMICSTLYPPQKQKSQQHCQLVKLLWRPKQFVTPSSPASVKFHSKRSSPLYEIFYSHGELHYQMMLHVSSNFVLFAFHIWEYLSSKFSSLAQRLLCKPDGLVWPNSTMICCVIQ